MFHGVENIGSLNKEIRVRLASSGNKIDCGSAGNFNATVAAVGDAPGDRDVRVNQPFVGGSGVVLFDAIRKQGLTRNHVYLTHAVKRMILSVHLPNGKRDRKPSIPKQEFEQYKLLLLEELASLPNLEYILALGEFAIKALVGEDAVHNWHGSVVPLSYQGKTWKVICSYSPSIVANDPSLEIILRMDLDKLRRLRAGTFSPSVIDSLINPSYQDALTYIRDITNGSAPFAYDIETMGAETACVGLADTEARGMCINWRTQGTNSYTREQEITLRKSLQELFTKGQGRSVAQNANFDNYWLWYKDRVHVKQTWFDTMLAHHLLYPSLPHSLGFLTSQYTDNPYYKDEGKEWKWEGDVNQFWHYNVKDCVNTLIVARKELVELQREQLDPFFFNHVMALQPHLVRMTVGGVLCDAELKNKISEELEVTVGFAKELCQTKAQEATGCADYSFNPRSPADLRTLFFSDLKLVGRGSSTDKENRERMFKHSRTSEKSRELIHAINDYLRDAKFLSVYVKSKLDTDDRYRCEYKQTGVVNAPGRLSSTQVMWGNGGNLQNWPERAKPMLIADPGYEFSYFDAAQIEARFVAVLANIKLWKEQFERARLEPGSYDAHIALASVMFNVPYDDVPKSDFVVDEITGLSKHTLRFTAKRCRHGLNYRMGPDRLAATAKLSMADAEVAYRLYHKTNPEIKVWWEETIKEARTNRKLVSPLGRVWKLLERWDEDALDSIVAFRPQSTAGDWIASVIHKCERDTRWPKDARMLLNIHDALISINRPDDGPLVRALMRSYAEEPIWFPQQQETIIVPADFGISQPDEKGVHRWSTIKKIKERPELLTIPRYRPLEIAA